MIWALLLAAGVAEPGLHLLRSGRAAEAAVTLRAALQADPRNAALANDLGFALQRAGDPAGAEHYYRLAIQLQPNRWYAYANLADLVSLAPDVLQRAGELEALLDKGLALAPGAGRANLLLHVASFERAAGRIPQARERLLALENETLSAAEERKARELSAALDDDERALSLADWPDAQPSEALQKRLAIAEAHLAGDPRSALNEASALAQQEPAWREAHALRAKALQKLGRDDDEARELRVLVQLQPSNAEAWKRLGTILAAEGGLLEAQHADEALRQALALEPGYIELWLLRARVALRQGRSRDALRALARYRKSGGADPEAARVGELALALPEESQSPSLTPQQHEPSAEAREWFAQAGAVDVTPDAARELLKQALVDSPAYVEAATALVALGEPVPAATVQALHDDGPSLLALATEARKAGATDATVRPWVDRAAELGDAEALLFRAGLQQKPDDALRDLRSYAASRDPQQLDTARAMRARLSAAAPGELDALRARLKLSEDRPEAAALTLGGTCIPQLPPARLLALGIAHEYEADLQQAVQCYRLAVAPLVAAAQGKRPPPRTGKSSSLESESDPFSSLLHKQPSLEDDDDLERTPLPRTVVDGALERLARLGERISLPQAVLELRLAEKHGVAAALWALARIDLDAGREGQALPRVERFLQRAAPDDAQLPAAREAREAILRKSSEAAEARTRRRVAFGLGLAATLLALFALFFRGAPVAAALRKAPRLFPSVSRAVGELRHDVLKHRVSALSMIGEPGVSAEDIARAMLSPEPASRAVLRLYDDLRRAAKAQGVPLRRAFREPVFGPLLRDLSRAEKLVLRGEPAPDLVEIDRRLREVHGPALAALLKLGPRTRIDAGAVSGWIRDVEAEARRGGAPWRAPAILLQRLEVEFAVERAVLETIFQNLLRNAQAASNGGEVIVRLGEERDAAGRNVTVLLVGDSAAGGVSLESIEQRESGRGLSLIRDLVREWQGQVVVRAEEAPWKKAVGASFPAPPA